MTVLNKYCKRNNGDKHVTKGKIKDQSNSTMGSAFALHLSDPGPILVQSPIPPDGPKSTRSNF